MLVALGYVGWELGTGVLTSLPLAIVLPVAAAVTWVAGWRRERRDGWRIPLGWASSSSSSGSRPPAWSMSGPGRPLSCWQCCTPSGRHTAEPAAESPSRHALALATQI